MKHNLLAGRQAGRQAGMFCSYLGGYLMHAQGFTTPHLENIKRMW